MNDEGVRLDPRLAALIVVDMENDFCKPGGKLYHPEGIDEVIPKQKVLLEKCRGGGLKVIFVQSVRYENSPEFARFGQPPFIIKGTWGSAFIEELAPEDGEPVIEKNTHDCFYRTGMDELLTHLKIMPETHSVMIIGVASNVCVYHAVIGFHVRHYHVIVPTDCCAGWPSGLKMLETQMSDNAYNYNVKLTRSEKISLVKD